MKSYLEALKAVKQDKTLNELRQKAEQNKIPIIMPDTQEVILALMDAIDAIDILEIGTAVAYSAISFTLNRPLRNVDTIERNEIMYQQALANIQKFNLDKQIKVHYCDALDLDITSLRSKYDIIFIDAAKAQSIKFFNKYAPLLSEKGIIITDNILFHGCVESTEELSRNLRNLVKKIDEYNHYLLELTEFHTYFIDCGDGLAITMRNK